MEVIEETQKYASVIKHVLTDEEYEKFRHLSPKDKKEFFAGRGDDVLVEEEICPIGGSSKFKVVTKILSNDERTIAERMVEG